MRNVVGKCCLKQLLLESVFLSVQEERLRGRGTESEEKIAMRLEAAKEALAYAEHRGVYDLVVVNDDFETAYEHFEGYFAAVRNSICVNYNIPKTGKQSLI